MNGLIHRDVARHVQEHASGPHRSMQSRETIEVRINQFEQVLLDQFTVFGQQVGNRPEDHALVFPFLIKFNRTVAAPIQRRNTAG